MCFGITLRAWEVIIRFNFVLIPTGTKFSFPVTAMKGTCRGCHRCHRQCRVFDRANWKSVSGLQSFDYVSYYAGREERTVRYYDRKKISCRGAPYNHLERVYSNPSLKRRLEWPWCLVSPWYCIFFFTFARFSASTTVCFSQRRKYWQSRDSFLFQEKRSDKVG